MNTMIMDLLTGTCKCERKDRNTGNKTMDVSFLEMARRKLGKDEYDRKSKESIWNKSTEEKARAKKRLKKLLDKKYFEKKYLESKRVEELLLDRRLKSISKTQELNAKSLLHQGICPITELSSEDGNNVK